MTAESLKAQWPVTYVSRRLTDDDDINGSLAAAKLNRFQLLTEVSNMESKKKEKKKTKKKKKSTGIVISYGNKCCSWTAEDLI